jgi:quercetin dioxygenase-like cupin family protein
MAFVKRASELTVLQTGLAHDRRRRVDLVSENLFGSRDLLAYKVVYLPGDVVPEHLHRDAKHVILCLEGEGVLHSSDGDHAIGPGDVVVVPEGEHHSLSNPTEEDWTFIELCLPTPTETVWADPDYTPSWIPAP